MCCFVCHSVAQIIWDLIEKCWLCVALVTSSPMVVTRETLQRLAGSCLSNGYAVCTCCYEYDSNSKTSSLTVALWCRPSNAYCGNPHMWTHAITLFLLNRVLCDTAANKIQMSSKEAKIWDNILRQVSVYFSGWLQLFENHKTTTTISLAEVGEHQHWVF
mgnify:CR=1 FL=1